jgi:hypothetical protein
VNRQRFQPRGSALLLVVIILGILAMVGLGIVSRASHEGDAVAAKRQYDKSVSCADAARDMLMGKFSAYGISPTELTLNSRVEDKTLASGHYDNLAVKSVVATAGSSAQSTFGVSDVSNKIIRAGLGGQLYRMTVVCSGPASVPGGALRQNEVEFLVRFGL